MRRIVEIATDDRHLAVDRGFLTISHAGAELGRVPLDDIEAVIGAAHGLTYSGNLAVALAERGAAFVICGSNYRPAAFLWPVDGHHIQTARIAGQIAATLPTRKRLWQQIVRAKIRQQGAVLAARGLPAGAFDLLARKVRSGDPENIEAQAARRYWPLLMGQAFRRNHDAGGINALLNYGYAVLRAATARAIAGVGLHPSIGLHHRNAYNPMCLVDDLMEPWRPFVDLHVAIVADRLGTDLSPPVKRVLASVLTLDLRRAPTRRDLAAETTPLSLTIERGAVSLARIFTETATDLDLPQPLSPIELAQAAAELAPTTPDASIPCTSPPIG